MTCQKNINGKNKGIRLVHKWRPPNKGRFQKEPTRIQDPPIHYEDKWTSSPPDTTTDMLRQAPVPGAFAGPDV